MLPAQYEQQDSLPHSINQRRKQEYVQRTYQNYVSDNNQVKNNALFQNKKVVRAPRMSREQILMKIQFRENKSRQKLKAIYQQDFRDYQDELIRRKPTEEQIMQRMEDELSAIVKEKEQQKQQFNEKMNQQQFETECDEIREKRQKLIDKQQKLVWNHQEIERINREQQEKEIQRKIDQIVINDYKQYLIDKQQEHIQQKQRILMNKQALDAQLTEKEQVQAELLALKKIENEKEKLLTQEREQITQLENDCEKMQALQLQKELMIQIKLSEHKRNVKLEVDKQEYQKIKQEVELDIFNQQKKQIEDKENLYQLQTIYCEMVKLRRQKLQDELKLMDQVYMQSQNQYWDAREQQQKTLNEKRQKLVLDCKQHNYQQTQPDQQKEYMVEMQKKLELEKALRELQQYEEEKLEQIKQEILIQKTFSQFYEGDIEARKQIKMQERANEKLYANNQSEEAKAYKQKVDDQIKHYNDQIREIDAVEIYQNEKRVMPKKQWYNH